ncbi:MAG TPA: alpha/beta hydrolase-fold protein [Gemmatimonadaceae bacterium]|nr:alpha/beta hydrolase-fold protein [Gemmatimonadaceae bacterium]
MRNPRTVLFAIAFTASTAQLCRAQAAPALVAEAGHPLPNASARDLQTFQIASAVLHETRRIYVSLPGSFAKSAATRRYPVTVVVDGEELTQPVIAASEHLIRMGQIPEAIIVGVENTARLRDLTPPGLSVSGSSLHEGGDLFLDFIEKELLPAVDRQFRGGPPRAFVGHSSGGILATYVAATRSTFRAVVAIDTPVSLGDDWLAKQLTARVATAAEPLRYASYEARFGWSDDAWKKLVAAARAPWMLHREKLPRESHESMAMISAYLGLREVFSDYSMLAAPVAPAASILPHYAKVSADLGATVLPPRKLLVQVLDDLLAEGHGAEARRAYDTLVQGYGAPPGDRALEARVAGMEHRPPPKETVESLLATPFPTPEEARAFIGDWVGDLWMGPEQPRTGRQVLRIRVVDGRVVGETINHLPSGEDLVHRWDYMRITPAGMTFGVMNGMRPRGVVLFEGTLTGDTLAGASRFGGIEFTSADGTPPALHFSFKRASK